MSDTQSEPFLVRHRAWVVLVAGLLVYVPFLGLRELWYPDEPDIGEVCRAMFERGDWIVPYRNGQPWIDYWPALYWAGTAAAHVVGGISEFALRLPSALGAIALALATQHYTGRRYGGLAGLCAGLVMTTFGQFAYNAVSYRPDILASLLSGVGMFVYANGTDARRAWAPRLVGFAFLGLAVLVKGPIGLLLPGLILTLWHLLRREFRLLVEMAPLTVVAIAVALPWALACASRTSAEWFWGEIYAQNFMRFDEGGRGHIHPWHYYLTRIWADLAPWSPLLPFVLVASWRRARAGDRDSQLALLWFLVSFAFWSWATTKRQVYLLPAYPALGVMFGSWLGALGTADRDARPLRWLANALAVTVAVLGVGALLGGAFLPSIVERITATRALDPTVLAVVHASRVPAMISGGVFVLGGLWVLAARRRSSPWPAFARTTGVALAVYALGGGLLAPPANPLKSYEPACRWIRAEIGDERQFGLVFPSLAHHKMGAFGYYTGALVALLPDEAAAAAFLVEHPRSVVLVEDDSLAGFLGSDRIDWRARQRHELEAGRYHYTVFGAP